MAPNQLPWDDKLIIILFKIVIQNGAHLGRNKDKWNEVNRSFFNEDACFHLKNDHYNPDNYRKIKVSLTVAFIFNYF